MNLPHPIDIYCENGRLGMRGPLEVVRARRCGGYGTVKGASLLTYRVNTKETTAGLIISSSSTNNQYLQPHQQYYPLGATNSPVHNMPPRPELGHASVPSTPAASLAVSRIASKR